MLVTDEPNVGPGPTHGRRVGKRMILESARGVEGMNKGAAKRIASLPRGSYLPFTQTITEQTADRPRT